MNRLLSMLMMTLVLNVGAAHAGAFEDGQAAAKRGDKVEALKQYRIAAEQGDAAAQNALGYHFKYEANNYAEALKWYRLSAAQGFPIAIGVLGLMYDDGLGVPQDYVRAHMWYNINSSIPTDVYSSFHLNAFIAEQDTKSARMARDTIARKMTPAQIAEAQRLASECLQRKFKDCN